MLKRSIKKSAEILTTFIHTVVSMIRILTGSDFNALNSRLTANRRPTLLVLGNGPSLNKDIKKYSASRAMHDIVVVNNFVLSEDYSRIQPRYYVFLDDAYWQQSHNLLVKSKANRDNIFNLIKQKTKWPLTIIVPTHAYRRGVFQEEFRTHEYISIVQINNIPYRGFPGLRFRLYDLKLAAPNFQNVLVACLYIGISLKYSRILILGADHNWTSTLMVNESNEVCTVHQHFYSNGESKYVPWKNAMGTQYKMSSVLGDLAKMFSGYEEIKCYADHREVNIFNLTQGSFIDSFDRLDVSDEETWR
jgi:hypothetical protein